MSQKEPEGLDGEIPVVKANRLEIQGEQMVTGLVADGAGIPCEGVFVRRDAVASTDLLPQLETNQGSVVVDRAMATNIPGVFAAGDCTGAPLQIAKAVGEGHIAGLSAADWLDKTN